VRSDALVVGVLGPARAGGSDEGPHGPDHRGAGRARPAPERESRAPDRTRNPKKTRGLLREAPAVRFAWIAAEKAVFTVTELCRALDVAPSGFYAWCQRPASTHTQTERRLRVLVRASVNESRQRYGRPRVP